MQKEQLPYLCKGAEGQTLSFLKDFTTSGEFSGKGCLESHSLWISSENLVDAAQEIRDGVSMLRLSGQENMVMFVDICDGNIARWIDVLQALKDLPIKLIMPDCGAIGNAQAIETSLSYLHDLQVQVKGSSEAGVDLNDAVDNAPMPDFLQQACGKRTC